MNLARSTYCCRPHRRAKDEDALKGRIEGIRDEFPRYGCRRVTAQLRHEGWHVNHKRVARIMRESGLSAKPRRRSVSTSDGSQYGWSAYRAVMAEWGMRGSMSGRDSPYGTPRPRASARP